MTAEERHQYLSLVNEVKTNFILKNLRNPDDDLSDFEVRFDEILKEMRAYDKWPEYFRNALKNKGIVPERNISLPQNRDIYIEIVTEFLDGLYDKIATAPDSEELPTQNVPLDEIRAAIKAQDLKHAEAVQYESDVIKRWLEIIKKHNKTAYAQIALKLTEADPEALEIATKVIVELYQQHKTESVIESKPFIKSGTRRMAQESIEAMRRRFAQISAAEEETVRPEELSKAKIQADRLLKTPEKQLVEATVAAITALEQTVPAESWINLPSPESIDGVAAIAAHLKEGLGFLETAPITNPEIQEFQRTFPQGYTELKQAKLTTEQIATAASSIVNIQKHHPDVKKLDSLESVSLLTTGVREVLRRNGIALSDQGVLGILSLVYDSPQLPEKALAIRNIIQTVSFSNVPPLWEKTEFRAWVENNREQINRLVGFWQEYMRSADASKFKGMIVPNLNLLSPSWLMRLRELAGESAASASRSFFGQFTNLFRVVFGKSSWSIKISSGVTGAGRTLFGWAGRSILSFFGGLSARFAAGTAVAAGAGTLPVWVIALLIIVPLLFLTGFLSGPVDTAALLPPPRYGITGAGPGGAGPPVPPGQYIPPGGCAATQTMGTCCVPLEGWCSVAKLAPVWGSSLVDGAAQVCINESGGNTAAVNDGCFSGKSAEYSVGLFQFNMLYTPSELSQRGIDCMDGFGAEGVNSNDNNVVRDAIVKDGKRCYIRDQNTFEKCRNYLLDPMNSIRIGKQKYVNWQSTYGGTEGWHPWTAARCGPDLCNLDTCHTIYSRVVDPCDCK